MKKIEFKSITMKFPGVTALDDVSFSAEAGKITSLLGENGAGKSTLLKILYGDYHATSGEIFIDDKKIMFSNPHEAIISGVSVIYQERQLYLNQTVAENVFAGSLPTNKVGLVNYRNLNRMTEKLIKDFDLPIKPTEKVKDLSPAIQQMVEIMKSVNRRLEVVAFDEPTASLTDKETDKLFEIINKLKQRGLIVLYVSHRLKEIFRVCDDVVILKDGKFIDKVKAKKTSEDELVKKMVGRKLGDVFNNLNRNKKFGETILNVEKLNTPKIKEASFSLRKGEILGFFGLAGAGRTELMDAIFGNDVIFDGKIIFNGKEVEINNPSKAIKYGIGLSPEDRKEQAIMKNRTVRENISVVILKMLSKFGFIDSKRELQITEESIKKLNIQTPNVNTRIIFLSGGNQQKVIVARWLALNPKILILDEPTKGIDVGAKEEMYKIICSLAREKIGVIFISSELPEMIGLCDRILVIRDGMITGEVNKDEATEEKLLKYAIP